jgi:fructose-specific PTS system IIA-like component
MNDCKQLLKQASTSREISEIRSLVHSAGSQLQNSPLLSEELIVLDSDSNTKEEAIQELVDIFYAAARTHDRRRLEDAVWAREAVYSTGLGFGFATPHCKTDAVNASSIGVLRLKHPVDWGAADHESVRMVILIAMREQNAASGHMQVFSELARKLMNEDFRERLLSLKDPQVVMHYLGQELAF